MAKAKTENEVVASFRIFDKPGKNGNRVAIDLATGTVIESDGPGKFIIYVHGNQHSIVSQETLEQISGIE